MAFKMETEKIIANRLMVSLSLALITLVGQNTKEKTECDKGEIRSGSADVGVDFQIGPEMEEKSESWCLECGGVEGEEGIPPYKE